MQYPRELYLEKHEPHQPFHKIPKQRLFSFLFHKNGKKIFAFSQGEYCRVTSPSTWMYKEEEWHQKHITKRQYKYWTWFDAEQKVCLTTFFKRDSRPVKA